MNLPPEIARLAHNKKALAGIGGVAVLGLYMHSRSKATGTAAQSASGGAATTSTGAGASSSGGVADGSSGPTTYPNTYGTDLATALGNIDSQYAGQVQQFNSQLGTDSSALSALQSQVNALPANPAPVPVSAGNPKVKTITVKKGQTQAQLDKLYGISYSTLQSLNPALQKKGAKIKAGQKVVV